jgi:hypothetical protein
MQIDFLFIVMTPGVEVEQYFRVGSRIQEKGYRVAFLCDSATIKRNLLGKGAEQVFAKGEFLQFPTSESGVGDLEDEYGLPSLRALYLPELAYLGIKEDQAAMVRIAASHLLGARLFLSSHSVGCIVCNQGANLLVRAFYHVGKTLGVPFIFVGISPIKGKSALYSNEYAHWESLDRAIKEGVSDDELLETSEYVENVKKRRETLIMPGRHATRVLRDRVQIAGFSLRETLSRRSTNLSCPNSYTLRARLRSYGSKRVRQTVGRLAAPWLYGSADLLSDKYIFLPLHLAMESQLTVRAQPYANQEFLVEYVARSLPQGYKLYVKEHPDVLGSFSLRMLRRIGRIGNVVLVRPSTHPHDLIANAAAIATINSTAGFEALLFLKPVIVFGHAFYRGYGATYDVESLYDLDRVIKGALQKTIVKDTMMNVITAIRKASYNGSLDQPEDLAESIVQVWVRASLR